MQPNKGARVFYGWWLVPILLLVYSIPIGFVFYGPPVINTFMSRSLGWQRGEINLGYTILGVVSGLGAIQKSGASTQNKGDWWSAKRLIPPFSDDT